ncbi:hypothetical protein Y032_0108g18 [Ancylostoma ceylanicum]|uniref:Metalloendopeptidase n=1 Tax=Ancylostoma ceylanicum TaxID=53326 RepID=A0A016TF20_9BILA|nr:hypothetical protein Y032_0108g18 [Ancylostoma ceylanicum]
MNTMKAQRGSYRRSGSCSSSTIPGIDGGEKNNQTQGEGNTGTESKEKLAIGGFGDLWKNLWGTQTKQEQQNDHKSLVGTLGSWGHKIGGIAKKAGEVAAYLAGDLIGVDGENIIDTFREWSSKAPPPEQIWKPLAAKFCRRFPGHPTCKDGNVPTFNEIPDVIEAVIREGGKYLPKVPKLLIPDPLMGIAHDLVKAAKEFVIHLGVISPEVGKIIKGVCETFKCMEQSKEQIAMKNTVTKKIFEFEKAVTGKDNTDNINFRLDRTMQVKQALLEKANLSDVVTAADNGVFESDVLLTEHQSNFLLNELGKAGEGVDVPPPGLGSENSTAEGSSAKLKRASLFFEENPIKKWDLQSPIPYTLDDSLDELDKEDIRGALKEIEEKTCIRFEYVESPTGYHINYMRVDSATFCGLSYIGRNEPANPIYLSFQCGNPRGVALHETLHALGIAHQHVRMDRDQHITLDWSNINPQQYDSFAVSDSKMFTTYGVKYDYGSIMHYNAYTAAVNLAKPTMIPKVDPEKNLAILGQRDAMSDTDIAIVKKMYCTPVQRLIGSNGCRARHESDWRDITT